MNRLHYAWVILAMGVIVVFGALGLARFGYSAILPFMQASLNMNNTEAGALVSANLLGYVLLSLIGGALAARYGPRLVISLGLVFAGAGMLFTGAANGFLWAMFWRTVTGVGSGASNVPVMGMLSAWFSTKRRGFAAGVVAGGSSVGLIVSGPLVPYILTLYGSEGWRIGWYLFGGATLLFALLSYLILRNRPSEIGLTPNGDAASAVAAGGGAPSGSMEWGRVYRSAAVWHLGLVYIAFGFSYIIYMTFFTKSLISESGYSKEDAGSLFMLMGWLSFLSGLIWGAISDRIGRKHALILVYLCHAIAFAMFALWRVPLGFTLSAIIFGLAAWSIPTIMAATCGDVLGARLAPAALGFITLFFGLGQAIGPSVAGAMADAMKTFAPAYLLAAVVALLGAGAATFLKPTVSNPSGL